MPWAAGPGLAALLGSSVGSFLLRLAVSFIIGRIQQNRMKKKMEAMQKQATAVMVNSASNSEPIRVVYGRTRLGGNRVFTESTNGAGDSDGSTHLNMVLAMAEGEVSTIRQLWFDDTVAWDIEDGGTIDGAGVLGGFIGKYAAALNADGSTITYHTGADDQVADPALKTSLGSSWTDAHRLQGIAYLGIKLAANAEVYKGGLPLFTAVIEDKQILDVSQLPTQTFVGGANQNPVDVLYDYMTNTRYGKGLDHNSSGDFTPGLHIDLASFQTAHTQAAGYYQINGALETSEEIYNNIGEMLESMNGILVFQNGKYRLRLKRQNEPSVKTFTADEILSSVGISLPSKSKKLNKITAQFRNREDGTNYNDDIEIVDSATYLGKDNGQVTETDIRLDLVDDRTLVNSIAAFQMNESRSGMVIDFEAPHTVLKIECGEIVTMQLPEFGWEAGKQFRIATMSLTPENTISIQAIEYDSSIQLI